MLTRSMKLDDYERVYALWTCTNGVGLRSLDDSKEGIARFLRRNPSTNFVAEHGGQIAGAIMCGHDGRRAYIYHAAVAQSHRKQGIGRQLVDAAIDAAKKLHINKVALVVFADNAQARTFWARMGFELRDDLSYADLRLNDKNI